MLVSRREIALAESAPECPACNASNNMDREVEVFVKSGLECQLIKTVCNTPPITLTDMPKNAWDYVSMDLASSSEALNFKALVLTDNYSRFLVAVPMKKRIRKQ